MEIPIQGLLDFHQFEESKTLLQILNCLAHCPFWHRRLGYFSIYKIYPPQQPNFPLPSTPCMRWYTSVHKALPSANGFCGSGDGVRDLAGKVSNLAIQFIDLDSEVSLFRKNRPQVLLKPSLFVWGRGLMVREWQLFRAIGHHLALRIWFRFLGT